MGWTMCAKACANEGDTVKLGRWLDQVEEQVLDNLDLFVAHEGGQGEDALEDERREQLADLLALCQVNLAVDNTGLAEFAGAGRGQPAGAQPVPAISSTIRRGRTVCGLFGIHAGGLLRAHGGFLMLFCASLAGDAPLWGGCGAFCAATA